VGAVAIMAEVAITAVGMAATTVAGTAVGMAAMAVGTAGTVDGKEATVAGAAGIGDIRATLTVGASASALAGDRIGATATLMCTDTAQLGLRRILHTVTLTHTVIPMCHLAT
jgi:hypothetical protein